MRNSLRCEKCGRAAHVALENAKGIKTLLCRACDRSRKAAATLAARNAVMEE